MTIIRRRDVTRWYYLLNTIRGRLMLFTLFVELLTLLVLSLDADKSINSVTNKQTFKAKHYNQPPRLPRPEPLIEENKFLPIDQERESIYRFQRDTGYKYEKYEILPDYEKEFERIMARNKPDQDEPAMDTSLNDKIYWDDQNKDDFQSLEATRKVRSHHDDEGVVTVVTPQHVVSTFLWLMYLFYFVYNFLATLIMAYVRMFWRVDRKTSIKMWVIILVLNFVFLIFAIVAMTTRAVTGSVIITLLGAGIFVLNSFLPVNDFSSIISWFQDQCGIFNSPPPLPLNPPPIHPLNKPPNFPLNPPPNISLDAIPDHLLNSPTAIVVGTVDQPSAGTSGTNGNAQPRHAEIDLGDCENSEAVDMGDIGRSSPKVRFAIESEESSDSIVTYMPGRNSPIATISKSVILQYNGNSKKSKSGICGGSVEGVGNQEQETLEQNQNETLGQVQAIALEEPEKLEHSMGLTIQVSLSKEVGRSERNQNGRSKSSENLPKQKSRSPADTKNILGNLEKFRVTNVHQNKEVGDSNDVENNGNQTDDNNGNQTDDNNGNQTDDNNGNQTDDNNGNQNDDNNGNQTDENNANQTVKYRVEIV